MPDVSPTKPVAATLNSESEAEFSFSFTEPDARTGEEQWLGIDVPRTPEIAKVIADAIALYGEAPTILLDIPLDEESFDFAARLAPPGMNEMGFLRGPEYGPHAPRDFDDRVQYGAYSLALHLSLSQEGAGFEAHCPFPVPTDWHDRAAVDQLVYDLEQYFQAHPGKLDALLLHQGKDLQKQVEALR